jgi:DNA-binding winged helix-turn-helix (wHTH) protein
MADWSPARTFADSALKVLNRGIKTMSRRDVPATARFGRFLLDAHRHELLADGMPVRIGGRALDVLIVLTAANGDLVTKDELMSRVWPGAVVEENTLQFQISALRKALGPDRDFIKTISGRGYRFIADISTPADLGAASLAQRRDRPPSTNPTAPTSDFIGSEAILAELADLVAAHRLATLAGGGTDQTRQGMELRRRLPSEFTDRAWITALGPLPDPELVLPTVATVLGLTEAGPTPPEGVTATLRPKPLLFLVSIGAQTRP